MLDDINYDLAHKETWWRNLFGNDAKKNLLVYEPFLNGLNRTTNPEEFYNYLLAFKEQFWEIWEQIKSHISYRIRPDSPNITKSDARIVDEWGIDQGLKKINKKKHRRKGNRTNTPKEIRKIEKKKRGFD